MPKIWKQNQDVSEKPNRNNFDLRYQNHLTMKMGTIYPIMCKECVPGDSFRIDTAFGLKFMPLVFPVQSHMRAHVHYFYVPNRILWSNWKNYLEGLEEHEHPYISQPTSWFKTGSLCDYMDVPTTTVNTSNKSILQTARTFGYTTEVTARGGRSGGSYLGPTRGVAEGSLVVVGDVQTTINGLYSLAVFNSYIHDLATGLSYGSFVNSSDDSGAGMFFFNVPLKSVSFNSDAPSNFFVEAKNLPQSSRVYLVFWKQTIKCTHELHTFMSVGSLGVTLSSRGSGDFVDLTYSGDELAYFSLLRNVRQAQDEGYDCYLSLVYPSSSASAYGTPGQMVTSKSQFYLTGRFGYNYDSKSVGVTDTPFANDIEDQGGEPVVRLNALPFRAYEAIYWSYFSNTQNQGFYIDGVQKFNRWNTTLDDGADTTDYHLFRRNYELDFLTSALPSPQFGAAPLVGMTALGDITVEDDINGVSTFHAEVDEDGNITKVVATSPVASISHARTAMNLAAVGMNINDFRATNSFQRFLEQSMRSGYRYIDFIKGHFGVSPKRVELDMPVYIGGTSQDVSVNMVSNMTAGQSINGNEIPLGEFAGTANCFGQSKHQVSHFCDDYGWIIGVMCVVPDPAYSQLLPKHFLHDQRLSYYFPQFAQNGMQPITYKEVAPLTAYQDYLGDNNKLLTDTFGYQRPNYDLVGYTDQVHGLFRTDLKDFLIHRIFETRPELGTDFLEIKPDEVNDIFAYRDPDTDTILGQVIVDVKAKRPVPRVVVPALGR